MQGPRYVQWYHVTNLLFESRSMHGFSDILINTLLKNHSPHGSIALLRTGHTWIDLFCFVGLTHCFSTEITYVGTTGALRPCIQFLTFGFVKGNEDWNYLQKCGQSLICVAKINWKSYNNHVNGFDIGVFFTEETTSRTGLNIFISRLSSFEIESLPQHTSVHNSVTLTIFLKWHLLSGF